MSALGSPIISSPYEPPSHHRKQSSAGWRERFMVAGPRPSVGVKPARVCVAGL